MFRNCAYGSLALIIMQFRCIYATTSFAIKAHLLMALKAPTMPQLVAECNRVKLPGSSFVLLRKHVAGEHGSTHKLQVVVAEFTSTL